MKMIIPTLSRRYLDCCELFNLVVNRCTHTSELRFKVLAEAMYLNEVIMAIIGLRRTGHARDYSTDCLDSPSKSLDLGHRKIRHERVVKPHVRGRPWELLTYAFSRQDSRQPILLSWLQMELEDLVLFKATWFRLNYEARTWERTFRNINSRVNKSLADIDELSGAIGGWLADIAAGRVTADSQRTITASCKNECPIFISLLHSPWSVSVLRYL